MKEIKLWTVIVNQFSKMKENIRNRKADRLQRKLKKTADDDIQVREWDGQLYLSYNDIPLLPTSLLKDGLLTSVESARKNYVKYKANES